MIKNSEEYLNMFKNMYSKCRSRLTKGLFKDNYYENEKYSLFKPVIKSQEDEIELFRSYKHNKSKSIKDTLFNQYLIAALYLANYQIIRYHILCNDYEEYVSYNTEELLDSIEKYDCDNETNATFLTYHIDRANKRIRQYLNQFSKDVVGRGVRWRRDFIIAQIKNEYQNVNQVFNLSSTQFYQKYHMRKDYFISAYLSTVKPFSEIDENISSQYNGGDCESLSLEDVLPDRRYDPSYIDDRILFDQIKDFLKIRVNDRDFKIWNYYFNKHNSYTYDEIGSIYHITRERVRQILNKCNKIIINSKQFDYIR